MIVAVLNHRFHAAAVGGAVAEFAFLHLIKERQRDERFDHAGALIGDVGVERGQIAVGREVLNQPRAAFVRRQPAGFALLGDIALDRRIEVDHHPAGRWRIVERARGQGIAILPAWRVVARRAVVTAGVVAARASVAAGVVAAGASVAAGGIVLLAGRFVIVRFGERRGAAIPLGQGVSRVESGGRH